MSSDRASAESSKEVGSEGGPLELQELEEELCRLGGVLAVRVVGDRIGRPIEVHVLADNSKPAKQTVRDVRSVAQTVFGLELDHRIVSVAQFDTNDDRRTGGAQRSARAAKHAYVSRASASTAKVCARRRKWCSPPATCSRADSRKARSRRSVDRNWSPSAALDALRQVEPAADAVHLSAADIARIGKSRIAVVTVVWVEPPLELAMSGSAIVRRDRDDAIARALLDAVNRRISRMESGAAH